MTLDMPSSLLVSIDSSAHIHLVIGSNPLAASRCAKSLEVGANAIVIAPAAAEIHYGLQRRIDSGEVKWIKRSFEEQDLFTLGRDEVSNVVDAVFVTSGLRDPLGMPRLLLCCLD